MMWFVRIDGLFVGTVIAADHDSAEPLETLTDLFRHLAVIDRDAVGGS